MTHCPKCGGVHKFGCKPRKPGAVDWVTVMAYRVKPGHEMTLLEIGELAGVSRERIRQVEFEALRKLSGKLDVRRAVTEALRS